MKNILLMASLVLLCGIFAFAATAEEAEEVDFLLFFPNSSNRFVNDEQAHIQLDFLARYLLERNLAPGQIMVVGYAAVANNDIEPVNFSRERALFVMQELQKRGVPASLFSEPLGHGEVNTWGSNANEEDKIPNRRVRILVEDVIITPSMIAAAEPPAPVIIKEEIIIEEAPGKPSSKFPWGILLLLLLLLLLLALLLYLLKRKKKPAAEQPVRQEPVEEPLPPPVVAAAPPPAATREVEVDLEEEIRFCSYMLYLERGCLDGYRDEDWHTAVFQVCSRYEAAGYTAKYEDWRWKAVKTENC